MNKLVHGLLSLQIRAMGLSPILFILVVTVALSSVWKTSTHWVTVQPRRPWVSSGSLAIPAPIVSAVKALLRLPPMPPLLMALLTVLATLSCVPTRPTPVVLPRVRKSIGQALSSIGKASYLVVALEAVRLLMLALLASLSTTSVLCATLEPGCPTAAWRSAGLLPLVILRGSIPVRALLSVATSTSARVLHWLRLACRLPLAFAFA